MNEHRLATNMINTEKEAIAGSMSLCTLGKPVVSPELSLSLSYLNW